MRVLTLAPDFPLPGLERAVADGDTMHTGSGTHYLAVGLEALRLIEDAVGHGPAPRRILDLPCGHGRVTRFLRARWPDAEIAVSDVDADGVAFSAARFGARTVPTDGDFRALRPGGDQDLVWIGSLVTHLPSLETRRLLDLVVRVLSRRGCVVLTSHGEHVAGRMRAGEAYGLRGSAAAAVLREYDAEGYGYRNYPGGVGYGVSLVSRGWYERLLEGSPLRLDRIVERGWDGHQDVLVLRRAPTRFSLSRLAWGRKSGDTGPFEAADDGRARHVAAGDEEEPLPPSEGAPEGFDEAWYLGRHPDIREAVERGDFTSGLDHYLRYGRAEGRPVSAD